MPLNDMQCAWQIWAPFADLNVGTYTRDIFDAYMPMVRYEAQPGLGLAIRKYTLAQRGVMRMKPCANRGLRSAIGRRQRWTRWPIAKRTGLRGLRYENLPDGVIWRPYRKW
jgi:hypothetical protein